MRLFTAFPLLLLPLVAYNVIAFAPAEAAAPQLSAPFVTVPMASAVATGERAQWVVSYSDLFITVSLLLLFFEVIRSTGTRGTIANHALSFLVFVVALVEFLLLPRFATTAFFLVLLMSLLDVLAGFIITLTANRRDISVVT